MAERALLAFQIKLIIISNFCLCSMNHVGGLLACRCCALHARACSYNLNKCPAHISIDTGQYIVYAANVIFLFERPLFYLLLVFYCK